MKRFLALFISLTLMLSAAPAFAQGSSTPVSGTQLVAVKKVVKKKKKKVIKKVIKKTVKETIKDTVKDTVKSTNGKSNSNVNADISTFKNANYKGPFPAPEGMVLEGTSGENQFKDPTGSGKYRFRIQTAWENHLACLDKTRTVKGSKGKTWEEGWWKGYNVGTLEGQRFVAVYDETPQGGKAGNDLYDEGYRLGYNRGFAGGSAPSYGCSGHDVDLSDYDADGWWKIKLDGVPGLKGLYFSLGAAISTGSSLLGPDGVYVSFDNEAIHSDPFSKNADPINLTRADFLVSDLDAAEQKKTDQEIAQETYDIIKGGIDKKYHAECTVDAPSIAEATYGKNTFTNLNFVVMCSTTTVQLDGSKKVDGKWMLNVYSFKRLPNNKMLLIQLFSPVSVKAKDKAELDMSKIPSTDFIDQFYSKMEF